MLEKIPIKLKNIPRWVADFRDVSTLPSLKFSAAKKYFLMGAALALLLSFLWASYGRSVFNKKTKELKETKDFLAQNKNAYERAMKENQQFVERRQQIEVMTNVLSFPLSPLEVLMEIVRTKGNNICYTSIVVENSRKSFVFAKASKETSGSSRGKTPAPSMEYLDQMENKNAFSIHLEGLIKGTDNEAFAIFDRYKKGIMRWNCIKSFADKMFLKVDPVRLGGDSLQMKFNAVLKNE